MNLKRHKKEEGTAIVLVLSILATLMVIVGVALAYTTNMGRTTLRSNTFESAIAVADGCLEHNFAQWRAVCKNPLTPKPTTDQLNALALPTQAEFPDVSNFTATRNDYDPTSAITVQQCKVIAVDPQLVPLADATAPTPGVGNGTITYNYLASAYVTLPALGPNGRVVAKVQRVFQAQQDSPFNYAIFYRDPLEIHPGPPFNVTGWVHTDSNLYTAHNSLNFSQKVTYSGNTNIDPNITNKGWSVGFDPGFTPPPNSPERARPGDSSHSKETPQNPTGVTPSQDVTAPPPLNVDASVMDPSIADVRLPPDSNPNNDGYHELIEPPILSGGPDPFSGSRYYDQASVIINIQDNPNSSKPDLITIQKGNGDGTATVLTSKSTGVDKTLYNMFSAQGAITTNQSIQDNREQAPLRITTLDVSKITTTNSNAVNKVQWAAGNAFNGTVYINDVSASPNGTGAKRGIRIANGSLIPNQGLTVASPNPVYVQGDFNTGLNPPSNQGDPTTPQAANYTRQPCSVIADAVNILSNAWLDANGGTVPAATPTTINSAIISGNVTSGSGFVYTGGAENFPRFLENWAGKDFTYYGSMIQLYQSQQSIGVWGKPNVYNAPNRKWYFDTTFKLNQPPGSNAFVTFTYIKSRWSLAP